jgi:hypothetical protein
MFQPVTDFPNLPAGVSTQVPNFGFVQKVVHEPNVASGDVHEQGNDCTRISNDKNK